MKKTHFLILPLVTLISFSCTAERGKFKLPVESVNITREDETVFEVRAEIAVKPEERNYGFMNRKNIPAGTGMLFVFETEQQLSFWMKNTPHPLSIAYIAKNGTVRDIFDMKPYSLSSILSTGSVKYALEVPKGWFEANGIKSGDKVKIPEKYR
ncbi:DUF192 domain-containing protein [Treponema sp.]|uniref:DUF192 domain-containing protein n=1 Tax=Treponema sp. TaxID=166 RepID=UPI00298DEC46|nr:DUF192 domain-containing protein [Treponema sp.]MCQ2240668.1 DUF192 domain-containing protein [Treponema sp.]